MDIKIELTTKTPLLQIDTSSKDGSGMDLIKIKTMTELYENMPVDIPIYTANGFRGLLRRKMTELMILAAQKKDPTIMNKRVTDFHLMMAGGGNNFQEQTLETIEQVKELNPVISLFGTSLAVPGKLIVTNLKPIDALIKVVEKDDSIYAYSQLVRKDVFIKKDDLLEKTKFGKLMSKEDIIEWEKFVSEQQLKRKKERESNSISKTKKTTIKAILAREYLIPNTQMIGFINTKEELTNIEKGMLLKALKELTKEQLGAIKSLGFGVCDYRIIIDEMNQLISKSKDNMIFDKEIDELYTDELDEYIKSADKFLKNISAKNLYISDLLK